MKSRLVAENATDARTKAILERIPPTSSCSTSANIFASPQTNSSNLHAVKLNGLKNAQFDPASAFANLFLHDSEVISNLNSKVTKEATNVKLSTKQYSDLPSKHSHTSEIFSNSRNKPLQITENIENVYGEQVFRANRAKKKLSKNWLNGLDLKPKFNELYSFFYSNFLFLIVSTEIVSESDEISIPYPILKHHPIDDASVELFRPNLSISSLNINFDDSKRWLFYHQPVDISNFM
jgi:hypothetical protein